MTTYTPNHYPLTNARALCDHANIAWSDDHASKAIAKFTEHQITQQAADDLVTLHVWLVAHLFNPRAYSLMGRIGIGLSFILGRRMHKLDTLPSK